MKCPCSKEFTLYSFGCYPRRIKDSMLLQNHSLSKAQVGRLTLDLATINCSAKESWQCDEKPQQVKPKMTILALFLRVFRFSQFLTPGALNSSFLTSDSDSTRNFSLGDGF